MVRLTVGSGSNMHSALPLFNWLFFELWVYSGSCKNTIFWGYLKHQKTYFWYDPSTRQAFFMTHWYRCCWITPEAFCGHILTPGTPSIHSWDWWDLNILFVYLDSSENGVIPHSNQWITVSSCSLLISIIGDIPEFQTDLYVLKQCWSIQWPDPVVPKWLR